uniref:NADH dehydrogenase subunit 6 n=1 Tax=Morishitium polonicum TaxID=1962582 RepID=UPI0023AA5F99|nr:NADH dehydrogenase subunit 6 [Morishitium polonicum]WCD42527.1 NADH dehydrogenase subunit 6 [Morishitium polonicum]
MLCSFLISFYFSCILAFSFVAHPVLFCVLLLSSALSASGIVYIFLGASWYVILFCLVYIGGVYVLFVFISIHNPNPVFMIGGGLYFVFVFFVLMMVIFSGFVNAYPIFSETSYYLCSFFEGFSYCFFCLILMVGFISISSVLGSKDSFYR